MTETSPVNDFGAWRVVVLQNTDAGEGKGVYALARAMGITHDSARNLLKRAPFEIPINMPRDEADALTRTLRNAGLSAEARVVSYASATRCQTHASLANDGQCTACGVWICIVCKAEADGAALCPRCFQTHGFWTLFRSIRVAALLVIFIGVAAWGWNEQRSRELRREWLKPVRVAVVVLERDPIPDATIRFLDGRLDDLESVLTTEFRRYHPAPFVPIAFEIVGDVAVAKDPPAAPPAQAGLVDNLRYATALDDYVEPARQALGFDPDLYDAVIYVVARTPADGRREKFVEGLSEAGGDMGLVEVDLDESMADLAAIAIGHEVFHTLGATDKYDANGLPTSLGLAEPRRAPLYPQVYVEIMAQRIPTSETTGRLPGLVGDVKVNAHTAREVGWLRD